MPIGGEKQSFTNENVEKAPEKHGVYALYDGNTIIYNGRAAGEGVTIRSRLKDHKSGREGKCQEKPYRNFGALQPNCFKRCTA